MKTKEEIEKLLEQVEEIINNEGIKFFGMSYEDGVKATIEYIIYGGPNPLEE